MKICSTIGCAFRPTNYTMKLLDYCTSYADGNHKVKVGRTIYNHFKIETSKD